MKGEAGNHAAYMKITPFRFFMSLASGKFNTNIHLIYSDLSQFPSFSCDQIFMKFFCHLC